jgi:hypothetical protein
MNYYEELGVRQDASVEEIRQAYKLTSRLLHPDRHAEPALQQVAEREMRRLGEIVAILVDAEKRSHYDHLLLWNARPLGASRRRANPAPAPAEQWESSNNLAVFALRYWTWFLTGILVMALGAWSFMQPNAAVWDPELHWAAAQRESAPGHVARQPVHNVNRPARRTIPGNAKISPVLSASRSPVAGQTEIPLVAPLDPHVSAAALENPPPRLDAVPEVLQQAPQSPLENKLPLRLESSFAGRWLYSPRAGDVDEGVIYPAIYVELLLVERDGELSGDYRARYKIPDKAVSPEVVFKVRGKAGSATAAKFAWVAGDNAKGTAEMTLRDPRVLCVTWWTNESGRQATLASGTAVLIRQQVP